MTFQSAPDCASAAIEFDIQGKAGANILHFHRPGGYTQAQLDALSSLIDHWTGVHYLQVVPATITYLQTLVRGLTSIVDLASVNNTNTGPGTATGAGLPANVSACLTFRTGMTGRSARGRFYAVPTTEGNKLTEQSFVHAYMIFLESELTTLIADAASIGWTMIVLSRRSSGAPRPVAVPFAITTVQARNDLIDSQRGRLVPNH